MFPNKEMFFMGFVGLVMQEPRWDVSPCRHHLIKWIIGNWEHKGGGDKVIRLVTLPWWGDITTTSTGQMTWSPATRRFTPAKVKVGVTSHSNPKYLSLRVLSDVLLNDTRAESFVLQMVIWRILRTSASSVGHWYSQTFNLYFWSYPIPMKMNQQDFNTRLLSLRPMAPLSLCDGKNKSLPKIFETLLCLCQHRFSFSVGLSIGFRRTLSPGCLERGKKTRF